MDPYRRRASGGAGLMNVLLVVAGSAAVMTGVVAGLAVYGPLHPAEAQPAAQAAQPGPAPRPLPAAYPVPAVQTPGQAVRRAPAPAAEASPAPASAQAPAPLPAPAPPPMPTVQTPVAAVSRSAPIGWAVPTSARRSADGHYYFDTALNGTTIRMLFDTGAGAVALRAEDAARAGIAINALNYNITVSTANGTTTAAAVRLETLQVGGITQHNVMAIVSRPGQLNVSLLGQSFMSKLAGYRIERDELILQGN